MTLTSAYTIEHNKREIECGWREECAPAAGIKDRQGQCYLGNALALGSARGAEGAVLEG